MGAVGPGEAVGRVVHLEHDVGAGLDELPLPWFQDLRRLARRVADQEIAGQRAASVSSSALTSGLAFGAVKKPARRGACIPDRSWSIGR